MRSRSGRRQAWRRPRKRLRRRLPRPRPSSGRSWRLPRLRRRRRRRRRGKRGWQRPGRRLRAWLSRAHRRHRLRQQCPARRLWATQPLRAAAASAGSAAAEAAAAARAARHTTAHGRRALSIWVRSPVLLPCTYAAHAALKRGLSHAKPCLSSLGKFADDLSVANRARSCTGSSVLSHGSHMKRQCWEHMRCVLVW